MNFSQNQKIQKIIEMKGKQKISMLTTYDFVTATYLNEAKIDIGLVGDSVGNVLLGYKNTLPVTMQEMLHHVKAVAHANPKFLLVADMPNKSYKTPKTALANSKKFLRDGAQAVKVEGPVIDIVQKLANENIPIMGHVGLTPQTMTQWRVQGKDKQSAKQIIADAHALQKNGCFSIVIETVPAKLGTKITNALKIPTIGIGAGPHCDGQVLVINDLIGLNAQEFKPRFLKQYLNLRLQVIDAIKQFSSEVKEKKFPAKENFY